MLEKYAQEISDTTANIIGYDVLVTDKNGIIIGSSNPERLGEFLNEVPQVISSRKGYIVSEEEARRVQNTQIGVTYPIEDIDGQIAGTIAITGDPGKVDPFALIVQKQAEMYLREKAFLETALYRERTIQALIKDILAFDPRISDRRMLEQKAREFGYEKKFSYVAIYMKYHLLLSGKEEPGRPLLQSRALSLLRTVFPGNNDISAGMDDDSILLFHALPDRDLKEDEIFGTIDARCLSLEKQMGGHGIGVSFGVGSVASELVDWSGICTEAREVLERGRSFYPSRSVFMIRDHRLLELVAGSRRSVREQFVGDILSILEPQRDSMELKETIQKWCQNDFCVKDTAEALHIHRNTLHYRIEKIERITGFSMRNFCRMMELYLALQLEKINSLGSSI